MVSAYIESLRKEFERYKSLGEKTFAQLADEELFWHYNEESNSIAIIVNHLAGNMLSRWTDFLNSDGEKEWRHRDQEFEDKIKSRAELLERWNQGWTCLFEALDAVNESNFQQTIYIRSEAHSIIEAFHRQLGHYASHIGQIQYIGRMIKGADWQSLSIPKGESENFNAYMKQGKS